MNRRYKNPHQNFKENGMSNQQENQFIEESEELRDYVLATSSRSKKRIKSKQELNITSSNFSSIIANSPSNYDSLHKTTFDNTNFKKPRMQTAKNFSGHTSLKQRMIQTYTQ